MAVGQYMGVFYLDDSMIGSRYSERIQGNINFLIRIFRRVRLKANVERSKTMICQPGKIHGGMSEKYFSRRSKV